MHNYFKGSQESLIDLNSIKKSCSSFKAFKSIYQKAKIQISKQLILAQNNLTQNLLDSYSNIVKTFQNSRLQGFQKSAKLELLNVISESLGNLTSEDLKSLETTYPRLENIDFANLKDIVDDYSTKLNGTEVDDKAMKEKLQQFFNEISQGFLKNN